MSNFITALIFMAKLAETPGPFISFHEKSYTLPDHGVLILKVPDEWSDRVSLPHGEGLPPNILFMPKSGEQFQILFTPIWEGLIALENLGATEGIRQLVGDEAKNASAQSVEKNIKINEIHGTHIGFYFTATDKAPRPGEYKYMTQGAVRIDKIIGMFTILTNNPNSHVVEQALIMFVESKHVQ